MVFDLSQIKDLDYVQQSMKDRNGGICYGTKLGKVFLVVHKNTIEVRTERELRDYLCEKYESVMKSRHFGLGGIEIVLGTQMSAEEVLDLVKLSYRMSETI